ncbi:hypothetical protein Cpir12675_006298 [Ceratocystis pirilliformis]|uniref:Uncharacterized protein n=1 Tax=Ceratocystis pirilliformis TaxID=259994 RepID=A0ABR3YIF9_9PEZI
MVLAEVSVLATRTRPSPAPVTAPPPPVPPTILHIRDRSVVAPKLTWCQRDITSTLPDVFYEKLSHKPRRQFLVTASAFPRIAKGHGLPTTWDWAPYVGIHMMSFEVAVFGARCQDSDGCASTAPSSN